MAYYRNVKRREIMKTKTKKELNVIVEGMVVDYNQAAADEKGKVLANLIKGVNIVKEIESQEIDNQVKKQRIKLDEEKLELDRRRIELDVDKFKLDQLKVKNDQDKFYLTNDMDSRKIGLEESKLDFDKGKFETEIKKSKADKVFNGVMKGLEIGLPLIIYSGLSILSLKAIYKDDERVPSETWNFIKNVLKK